MKMQIGRKHVLNVPLDEHLMDTGAQSYFISPALFDDFQFDFVFLIDYRSHIRCHCHCLSTDEEFEEFAELETRKLSRFD